MPNYILFFFVLLRKKIAQCHPQCHKFKSICDQSAVKFFTSCKNMFDVNSCYMTNDDKVALPGQYINQFIVQ